MAQFSEASRFVAEYQDRSIDTQPLHLGTIPVVEAILESYPRLNFKAEFRNLLVEHCRNNPAVQILTWTDDVARTAGCTLHGQPIPTASQIMAAAPFPE